MTASFTLKLPTKTVFGPGSLNKLPGLAGNYGKRPLLVSGARSLQINPDYLPFRQQLQESCTQVFPVSIPHEPSPEIIDSIVGNHRETGIDLVIAIGGGSCLDGGKAISVMLTENGTITDLLEGVGSRSPKGTRLPLIAVPTTSGTGSEATCNAVISAVGDEGFKKSLRHDNFLPDLALVDPSLTASCPKDVTAACGMDCFSQLVEGYLSSKATGITDSFALEGIRAVKRSLEQTVCDGSDIDARSDMAYATLLSGMVLTNAGLGTVHGFASVIGGLFPIPHGLVCGRLMEPTNRFTLKKLRSSSTDNPALAKYATLGRIFSSRFNCSDAWYQDFFIDELGRLSQEFSLQSFGSYGLQSSALFAIAKQTGNKNNPIVLEKQELVSILTNCL